MSESLELTLIGRRSTGKRVTFIFSPPSLRRPHRAPSVGETLSFWSLFRVEKVILSQLRNGINSTSDFPTHSQLDCNSTYLHYLLCTS